MTTASPYHAVFGRYNGFQMTALGKHDECTFVPVRGAESSVGGFVRVPLVRFLAD